MENIYINGQDQPKLAAYTFMPEDNYSYVLIVCHGFRGAKENGGRIFNFAERINALGMGLIAFDFSGSGLSEGDFADVSLSRQLEDLKRVIAYAHKRYNKEVILLGRSFGGSTVLAAGGCINEKVAGYILWSTPVNLYKTFANTINEFNRVRYNKYLEIKDDSGSYKLKPTLIEDFANHDMNKNMLNIGYKPVLVIHGRKDATVSPSNALCIYENCPEAELHIIAGADHRFSQNIVEREDITLKWLKKTFCRRSMFSKK